MVAQTGASRRRARGWGGRADNRSNHIIANQISRKRNERDGIEGATGSLFAAKSEAEIVNQMVCLITDFSSKHFPSVFSRGEPLKMWETEVAVLM